MSNRLALETSPYLRQHADNPVDWYSWCEQALALAREQDKPILLSIGYSACHWCHVMAHESFEDPAVAELMNQHFVNVKVDREERPDLDHIYQTAHAIMTQKSGGWPLTMFLMPDGTPFFCGTYFPKQPRYDLPGFMAILPLLARAYVEKRSEIEQQNDQLLNAMRGTLPKPLSQSLQLTAAPLETARADLCAAFDAMHGGFGDAPKFPQVPELELLLASGEPPAIDAVRATLVKMAEGGIYDQLGGGFCRYSVDREWTIPHFEKMLYDNGLLLWLYSDAWLVTREPLFRRVVEQTVAWATREMQSPQGGFYCALDADSEHEEGKFHVWTPEAVAECLSADEYAVVAPHFGLDRRPNFEGQAWHLRVYRSLAEIASASGRGIEECERLLMSAKAKLFEAREQRVRPGRDEKILASWNGLMIRGLAHAARVFGRADWLAAAQRAADFIRQRMWRENRLLAVCQDGAARLPAYLDDHAFLLDAMLELLQTEFRSDDLQFAQSLADALLTRFEDHETGGFYFTAHDHERLFHRPKTIHDAALPSGNGTAVLALQRWGYLIGDARCLQAAERTIQLNYPAICRHSGGLSTLLRALAETLLPPQIVILRGEGQTVSEWQHALNLTYWPDVLVVGIPNQIEALPPALDKPKSERVNAWVCQGVKCLPPVNNLEKLIEQLKRGGE